MTRKWKPPKALATPPDLLSEPEAAKALRLLRCLRHFMGSRYGVTVFEIDGQNIFIIKQSAANLPAGADTTSEAQA